MKILVINAGSSSLKYQLISITKEMVLAKGICERIGNDGSRLKHTPEGREDIIIEKPMEDHAAAISMVLAALTNSEYGVILNMGEIAAVGHRVVHGGESFSGSVIINEEVKKTISDCASLAPLHNPPNLIGIEACEKAIPGIPMVAVFDTAFHQTMPPKAFMYALPYKFYEKDKVRKYGFHGTSHKYVAGQAAQMLGRPIEELKIITLHLGNGSSMAAVKFGKSVDTSMGLTPLAGVMMGTRSGDIDPAIIKYLADKENDTIDEIEEILNKGSGVLGVSGVSSDFRDLAAAASEGNKRAALALDMFAYGVKKYIGAYAIAMGGIDAVVFTAGVGENTPDIRTKVLEDTEFMGIEIDNEKNKVRGQKLDISKPGAKVRTLVIPTNEELMIARDTASLVDKK